MITLVFADPHASSNPRDAYRWRFLEETLPALITEHGVSRVLILGDLTEAKSGHSAELVNRLVDALVVLARPTKLGKPTNVYLLKGNHDYLAEDSPFFRFARHLPNVHWINEPTALKLRGLGSCLFLPHSRQPTEEWKSWVDTSYNWYFCHQTFAGSRGENGLPLNGVSHDIFPQGARIVSGDVHVPQKVGSVTYAGAPYHIDFGDSFEPRILLLDGTKMRSVPVPGPQKRLVEFDSLKIIRRATLAGTHSMKTSPGDVVKVRVALPAKLLIEISRTEVRAQVREWAEHAGVQLYAVEIITPKVTSVKTTRDLHRASDADLIHAYVKKMDKGKAAIAAGLKLMEGV